MIDHSSDIKLRIVLIYYIVQLALYIAMFWIVSFSNMVSNFIFCILLIVGFAINLLANKRKYLSALSLNKGTLEIKYHTVFLLQKSVTLLVSHIQEFETTRPNVLVQYPCALNIKHDEKWLEYPILSKKLDKDVKEKLTTASIGFRQNGRQV